MTNTDAKRIAELNDRFRKSTLSLDPVAVSLGKKFMTSGIQALGVATTVEIAERVAAFDSFIADNDPYGEHDFGSFEYEGSKIFWKIDLYEDPGVKSADGQPTVTRVLTIMLAEEY